MFLMDHGHAISNMALTETFSLPLIGLSLFIAVLSSFTAFGTAERQAVAIKKSHKIGWNLFGAISMGLGIWTMHFIGMLALSLPIPISYNLVTTLLSILPAIAACSVVLWFMTKSTYSSIQWVLGGMLLAVGIASMHYIGMSAMIMNASMVIDSTLFYVSLIVAVILAMMALKLNTYAVAINQNNYQFVSKWQVISVIVMGGATSSMHYIAMAATHFYPQEPLSSVTGLSSNAIVIMVITIVFVILLIAIFIPLFLRHKQISNTLNQAVKRLDFALNVAKQGWYDLDPRTGKIMVSDSYAGMLGYTADEFETDLEIWRKNIHPDDVDGVLAAIKYTYETGGPVEHDYRRKGKEGDWIWLQSVGEVVERDEQNNPCRVVGIHTNITERKQSELVLRLLAESGTNKDISIFQLIVKELAQSQNMSYVFIGSVSDQVDKQIDTIAIWDGDNYGDNFSYSLKGTPCEHTIGEGMCFYPNNIQSLFSADHVLVEMGAVSYIGAPLKSSQNKVIGLIAMLNNKPMKQQPHIISLLNSLATRAAIELERIAADKQLELMAYYDVLTQLPNRTLFIDRFTQAVAHSQRYNELLAIIFLDVDNFKLVNDHYGHNIGDKLLIKVAKRITSILREEDTVSRQGGDEFALLLCNIQSIHECEALLSRLHKSLAEPYSIDNYTITIGASSGATLYPLDEGDIDTLLRHADQAMYQAKLAGKNRYSLFNTEDDLLAVKKQKQLGEIEQALKNNEFNLYYQPKVNMKTGKVFGVEALLRWMHPEKGIISPLDFLPLIENQPLELAVGEWVINSALNQLEQWQKRNINLQVSINISSYHLLSATFISRLDHFLARVPHVNAKNVQLEILETSVLGDVKTIAKIISQCQNELGVSIALDDFGTGYSSLTHIRSLAVDTIKIDQSFVRDLLDDPNDYAIVDGVIGLSNTFNREVIAEGVETTEHGLMLLMMGCEEAQGYGIARPMPAHDVGSWLQSYHANPQWLEEGNRTLSRQQRQCQLFRLVTQQWSQRFTQNILSEPANILDWPMMSSTKCSCGTWIKRGRQSQIFTEHWLVEIEKIHSDLHCMANKLQQQYQKGELDQARNGLKLLATHYKKVEQILSTEPAIL